LSRRSLLLRLLRLFLYFDGLLLDALQRSYFSNQFKRSGALRSYVKLLGDRVEPELRDLDAIMPRSHARQVEVAILVGPTNPCTAA
jgi:hypothetical protein